MSRWLPAVAIGAFLALVALALVFALRPGPDPTPAERAEALARQLRCPDCQSLSVADSPTQSAVEIRRQIDELVADGASDEEVTAHFVARYGEWVRLAPSAPALWVIPFAVVAVAAAGLLGWLAATGRHRRSPAAERPLADEERRRIHEEAEALDA
jgi:cytochrome c-type biogenesis protein CcmH